MEMYRIEKKNSYFLKLCILSFIFLMQGCYTNPTEKLFEKQNLINSVRKKALLRIEKEYGLIPFGTGGQARNKVEMLALAFLCDHDLSIEQGRELLIKSSDIFLDQINGEEKLLPYLSEYPFPITNIDIAIYIKGPKLEKTNGLVIVSNRKKKLFYYIKDPDTDRLKILFSEPYEEAINKVQS